MKRFYLWLCRWSYKKAQIGGVVLVGTPAMRDPNAICRSYTPRKRKNGDSECWGDGHYCCNECALYVPEHENSDNQ